MFQLSATESAALRSQIATLKRGQNIKYRPYAFTEHGAIMAANILNGARAILKRVVDRINPPGESKLPEKPKIGFKP